MVDCNKKYYIYIAVTGNTNGSNARQLLAEPLPPSKHNSKCGEYQLNHRNKSKEYFICGE